MLPKEVLNLINAFEDTYNIIEKKARIEKIILYAYNWWLRDQTSYCLFSPDEYNAKKEIFVFQQSRIFITNTRQWQKFLQYFRLCEKLVKINALEIVHGSCRTRLPKNPHFKAYSKSRSR